MSRYLIGAHRLWVHFAEWHLIYFNLNYNFRPLNLAHCGSEVAMRDELRGKTNYSMHELQLTDLKAMPSVIVKKNLLLNHTLVFTATDTGSGHPDFKHKQLPLPLQSLGIN